jgi:hypothetical protein
MRISPLIEVHRLSGYASISLVEIDVRYSRSSCEDSTVTTHLPNELALKMDGAEASDLKSTISANAKH